MKRIPWLVGWLICALLLAGCASGTGLAQASPTPFPTLPMNGTGTPTPYVFRPEDAEQVTPSPTPQAYIAIPVDGELVSVYPPLKVTFPSGVSGELLTLHVQLGQKIKAGDLIATLDDSELQEAIDEAQLALDKAIEDQVQAAEEADLAYQRAVEEAEWALEMAKLELLWATMRPPTAAVMAAQMALDDAVEEEKQAADSYKQSLDRPWEPQGVRDGVYKALQRTIADREFAEIRLQDAQAAEQIYYMKLKIQERQVEKAEARLAGIENEPCAPCAQAVIDAEDALADAEERLKHAQLYAPQDGLVVSIDAVVGSTVSSNTSIVTLINVEDLRFVTLNLNERHAAFVRSGQQVDIILRFFPDVVVKGEVEAMVPQVAAQSGARFVVYIRLTGKGELDLLPGMTGRAEITVENR